MSFTGKTPNYDLPQWVAEDKPSYLIDQNGAYLKIDTELKAIDTKANGAKQLADSAVTTAGNALDASEANAVSIVATNNNLAATTQALNSLVSSVGYNKTLTFEKHSASPFVNASGYAIGNKTTNLMQLTISCSVGGGSPITLPAGKTALAQFAPDTFSSSIGLTYCGLILKGTPTTISDILIANFVIESNVLYINLSTQQENVKGLYINVARMTPDIN